MRPLTIDELNSVVGGGQNSQDTIYPNDPSQNPSTIVVSVPDYVVPSGTRDISADLQAFFSHAENAVDNYQASRDGQNSNYGDPSEDTGPMPEAFMELFGTSPGVQHNTAAHFWDYLSAGIDPEFQLAQYDSASFTVNGTSGSSTLVAMGEDSSGHQIFAMNDNGFVTYLRLVPGWTSGTPGEMEGMGNLVQIISVGEASQALGGLGASTPGGQPYLPSPPVESYPSWWNHQTDYNIDKIAAEINDKINQKADHEYIEYQSWIYRNSDGVLKYTDPYRGTELGVSRGEIELPAGSVLVGEMHNHPSFLPDGSYNAYAVETDYGDMTNLKNVANSVSADSAYYRSYVTHSGYVSEYDYIQNGGQVPAGDPHTVYPGAVRGGYHPELGN